MSQKILYIITQSEFGGAQRYLFDLANNSRKEFDIYVAYGEKGTDGELTDRLDEIGIVHYRIPHLKRDISFCHDLMAIWEMRKLIKKLKPDIIHLNSSKISILGSIAGWMAKKPTAKIIYTVHGWVFNEPMNKSKKIFYRRLEKFTARLKNKIICIDNLDYDIARHTLKIDPKKLSLIYHGLDSDKIKFKTKADAQNILFDRIEGISSQFKPKILIGSIGYLYKTKGYEYLVEAIRRIALVYNNFAAIIIGEGEERKYLEEFIKKNDLENHIILAGAISGAASLLPAFDIYVCSSIKEGFPYSILEAMYAGLPVVTTNVGGIPDMIADNNNGLLTDPRDTVAMSDKILELIKSEEQRKILADQAQNDVLEKFNFAKMLAETKKIYLGE